ncbi:MAG: HD domain-containing protein, partial [Erysipelothrix sp.]|nr:HD domain-containing protein [Erysipelothrix sp.]
MAKALDYTKEQLIAEINSQIKDQKSRDDIFHALEYAEAKHAGQVRKSGESYFTHLVNVAYILMTLHVQPVTIQAGLLHDVIEDSGVTHDELAAEFTEEVASMVEAVTKIGNIQFKDEKEYLAENHRKIFIAMAKDVRVILIKLVDRLHNMRTLQFQPEYKQKKIANETLSVYAPIAHRLGINDIKN